MLKNINLNFKNKIYRKYLIWIWLISYRYNKNLINWFINKYNIYHNFTKFEKSKISPSNNYF